MNKEDVEKRARMIDSLLYQKGKLTIKQICQLLNETSYLIILSLGLLIKEGKILIYEINDELIVESTYSFSNMYY